MLTHSEAAQGLPFGDSCNVMTRWLIWQVPQVKNSPADAGDIRDTDSIPGSGTPLGGVHGNPRQDSCLENPMNTGAWQPRVHKAAKNQQD